MVYKMPEKVDMFPISGESRESGAVARILHSGRSQNNVHLREHYFVKVEENPEKILEIF